MADQTAAILQSGLGQETMDQALVRAFQAAQFSRLNEAMGICRDLLEANPEFPGALGLLGGILGQKGQFGEAIGFLERALSWQPGVANWHSALCAIYRGQNQLDKALEAGLAGVRFSPDTAGQRVELAMTHVVREEYKDAVAQFTEAIARDPQSASGHMGLGELLLAQGEYIPGWREYAWRNQLDQARGTLPKMKAAPWNGMSMPEGTLLLVADQGFGDMIHFCRYIPMARTRVGRLIVGWGPEVTSLLGMHPDVHVCFENWAEVPPHNAYMLLSGLPEIFASDKDTIPAQVPYLRAQEPETELWRQRLNASLSPRRLRVGIAWSGRPTHPNDARRSMRLETLVPILSVPDVDFVTVQKPFPERDRAFAANVPRLLDISADLASFRDTQAVIANLDLVISVDTAVAHLAGAMGVETWVLLAKPADWRWLLDREDSVWYPSLRLFRQFITQEWSPVVMRVAEALLARSRKDTHLIDHCLE
jgi:tetratricopeptide (TPR) repeat protein